VEEEAVVAEDNEQLGVFVVVVVEVEVQTLPPFGLLLLI
jgi:hypothetical protein